MATVMIVGATRGIGLELVRQYAEAGDQVIACARDLSATDQLQDLVTGSDAIRVEQMDVGDFASIDAAAERIGDTPLDALILCAGVNGGAKQSLDDVDIDEWHRVLDINTIGPTLIHQGGADPRVPPAHSRALYRALYHYLDVPVELVV